MEGMGGGEDGGGGGSDSGRECLGVMRGRLKDGRRQRRRGRGREREREECVQGLHGV